MISNTSNSDQAMAEALQLHQAGKLDLAAEIYQRVLEQNPDHGQALRLLGVIERQHGHFEQAISFLQQSLNVDPNRAETHHNLGDALKSQMKLSEAIAAYTRAVNLRPDWAEAFAARASAKKMAGELTPAISDYRTATRLNPRLAAAQLRLGDALLERGERTEAVQAFRMAIAGNPNLAEAHNNLGNVLWEQGKLDEAIASYEAADRTRPGYAQANWSLGKVLVQKGDEPQAIARFERAVQFNPENPRAHFDLGRILANTGQRDRAIACYRKAIELAGDAPEWSFQLAALINDGSFHTVPIGYIEKLFDGYASTFDEHLVGKLEYRAPEELLNAVTAQTNRHDMDILDIGCGTGLCGEKFKPLARILRGVDLSKEMIKLAAEKHIYDELIVQDAIAALHHRVDAYDLLIAGEVLLYIGDLSAFFPAATAALCDGGWLAFTIEAYEGDGYFLHSHERFAHSLNYIRTLSTAAGLRECSVRRVNLRRHRDGAADGYIIVLQKPIVVQSD